MNREQRSIVRAAFLENKTVQEVHKDVREIYKEKSMSIRQIYNLYRRFRSGDMHINDKIRNGRPVVIDYHKVTETILKKRHLSLRDLAKETGHSKATIGRIMNLMGFKNGLSVKVLGWEMEDKNKENKPDDDKESEVNKSVPMN